MFGDLPHVPPTPCCLAPARHAWMGLPHALVHLDSSIRRLYEDDSWPVTHESMVRISTRIERDCT